MISLQDSVSVEQLAKNLENVIQNQVKIPQVKYISNFHKFKQAVDICLQPSKAVGQQATLTLGDLLSAFEEPGYFALKVVYNFKGEKVKVDYNLTLSCFHFETMPDD